MDFQTLNLLFRCNKEFSHKKIRMKDMSDTECMICSYIISREYCSQDDVASSLKTDKTTVAKALASLEEKGLVTRTRDESDKRKKRLCITKAGRDRLTDLTDIHNKWLSEVMKCLSTDERKQFENYCERLLAFAEKLTLRNTSEDNNEKQQ